MKWIAKAMVQKFLSAVPLGEDINYLMQSYITRSHPVSDGQFLQKVGQAVRHFHNFVPFCTSAEVGSARFYEFGAGWDLAVPLVYHSLGVRSQLILDLAPHLRIPLVNDLIRRLEQHRQDIDSSMLVALEVKSVPVSSREELLQVYGIEYRAPADARDTGLPGDSIDFISSTETLEHIPLEDLRRIMKECRRILRQGGVMSCDIDLRDHYSYFDPSISYYNFLRFREPVWDLVNSSLHFQNRLRYSDYLALVEECGLEIVHQEVEEPSPEDLALLRTTNLTEGFQARHALEDLGVKGVLLVLRKT